MNLIVRPTQTSIQNSCLTKPKTFLLLLTSSSSKQMREKLFCIFSSLNLQKKKEFRSLKASWTKWFFFLLPFRESHHINVLWISIYSVFTLSSAFLLLMEIDKPLCWSPFLSWNRNKRIRHNSNLIWDRISQAISLLCFKNIAEKKKKKITWNLPEATQTHTLFKPFYSMNDFLHKKECFNIFVSLKNLNISSLSLFFFPWFDRCVRFGCVRRLSFVVI